MNFNKNRNKNNRNAKIYKRHDIYYVVRTKNIFLKIIISKKINVFDTILKLGNEKLKVNNK